MVNGARYLDPRTSCWLSTDPALGEYIPQAPVNDEAKKANQNLPGIGGVFNVVNLHLYHYAGNNPIRYTDPTGMFSFDEGSQTFTADFKDNADMVAALTTKIKYDSENGTSAGLKIQNGEAIELWTANTKDLATYVSATVNGRGGVTIEDVLGAFSITAGAMDTFCKVYGISGNIASKISQSATGFGLLATSIDLFQLKKDPTRENIWDFGTSAAGLFGVQGFFVSLAMIGVKEGVYAVAPVVGNGMNKLENFVINSYAAASGFVDFNKWR